MQHAEKDRDPEKARKRAKSDARCALRKLCLLESIEEWRPTYAQGMDEKSRAQGAALLDVIAEALGVKP